MSSKHSFSQFEVNVLLEREKLYSADLSLENALHNDYQIEETKSILQLKI
jgi:hypothetical protein